jgi:hypothetical protein
VPKGRLEDPPTKAIGKYILRNGRRNHLAAFASQRNAAQLGPRLIIPIPKDWRDGGAATAESAGDLKASLCGRRLKSCPLVISSDTMVEKMRLGALVTGNLPRLEHGSIQGKLYTRA